MFTNIINRFFGNNNNPKRVNQNNSRKLHLETLESRELLSVSPLGFDDWSVNVDSFIVAAAESDEIEYNAHDKAVVQSQGFPLNRFCNFELS